MIDVHGAWVERSESHMDLLAQEGEQERRIAALEHRITDLEEFLTAVASDMLDLTGIGIPDNSQNEQMEENYD